jgi:prepilin-type N-terminal cleavage/methylation domain-containing protein
MKKFLNNKKGFTLVEMLVVIFIIVLTASVTVANFRKGERATGFLMTTEQLASDLRKVQTRTIAGVVNDKLNLTGGYGLYISKDDLDQYTLFGDDGDFIYNPASDETLLTIDLPINVSFADLGVDVDSVTIIFQPPASTVYVDGLESKTTTTLTLLNSMVDNKKGEVTLNGLTGRITAELVNN